MTALVGHLASYTPGDEAELVALWNGAHAIYGGHVPRTVESWRWCILERPGVASEDVVILRRTGAVQAYGVLGPGGAVLELALAPALEGAAREAVAGALVAALERRCRERGDEEIAIELPRNDGPLDRLLAARSYRAEDTGSLQVAIVDLAALLSAILEQRRSRLPHGWAPGFRLRIAPGDYRFCPQREVIVRVGERPAAVADGHGAAVAAVEAGTAVAAGAAPCDCTLDTDLSTLTDVIFGRTGVEAVLASGAVAVEPASREQDARTLLHLLVLKNPWYTPYADGR